MKIKILVSVLTILLVYTSCKKNDLIAPVNNSNINSISNNFHSNQYNENITEFLPEKGAEMYCWKKDSEGNVICEGNACVEQYMGPCKIYACKCISFAPGKNESNTMSITYSVNKLNLQE